MIMDGETIVYSLSNWVDSQNHNQRSNTGVGTHWSDCFSNNLRYSLMNCLPGYVTILLNHCYKLNYKFKIILSNNKPHYSLFLLILKYPSLHVAARINIHMLQMVGMQDGGMYSSMHQHSSALDPRNRQFTRTTFLRVPKIVVWE